MKATSMSPRSGQRPASSNAVVLLHGHQIERNLARAVTAEAAGTFVLVLAITSTAVAAALSRPVAGAPYGSLAVPVVGGLALAIGVASLGHISGAHLNPAVTLGLAVNRHFPWAYAPGYLIAQFTGAIAAAAATWGLYGKQAKSIARLGATVPAAGVSRGGCSEPKPWSLSSWSWWSWRWPPTAGSRAASLRWPSARPSRSPS
jgi:glycerol uptake facilitator-like aquaporin